jgi:hypothetical protein
MPKLTILLSGMMAADLHQGGATWAVLQYVLGLRRLGHDVVFVEPVKPSSLQSTGGSFEESANAAYFREVANEFGIGEIATLLLADSQQTVGLPYRRLCQIASSADVLINISGMLTDPNLLEPIPRRIYLDLDPAFIQLWHAVQGIDMRFDAHTHFVTVGLALGQIDCPVPSCGRAWIPTLQPVVLDRWPVADTIRHDALTTIGNWRGYGSIKYRGDFYGQKAHSLRPLIGLPQRTSEKFALALAIHSDEKKDLTALAENGWHLIDPTQVAATPAAYQWFIQGSKAEFGLAKSGYVLSRCGWFSDRSACYLASGRPVLSQETDFSRFLPTGEGLFAFKTVEDVLTALDALNSDYSRHARAAREIAEEFFDSDKVLARLLESIGAGT